MLHLADRPRLNNHQIKSLRKTGLPPFKVRREYSISNDLGMFAIKEGFVQIPIYVSIDPYFGNDLAANACQFYFNVRSQRVASPITFLNELHTVRELAPAFTKIFKHSFNFSKEQFEHMTFKDSQVFGDMAYAEHFEFKPDRYKWRFKDWVALNDQLDANLLNIFTP